MTKTLAEQGGRPRKGEEKLFSELQLRLIEALAAYPNQMIHYDTIATLMYRDRAMPAEYQGSIRVLLNKIRQKLGREIIISQYGKGYMLNPAFNVVEFLRDMRKDD